MDVVMIPSVTDDFPAQDALPPLVHSPHSLEQLGYLVRFGVAIEKLAGEMSVIVVPSVIDNFTAQDAPFTFVTGADPFE